MVERRSRAPLVPGELFASARFTGANIVTLLVYGALGVHFAFAPVLDVNNNPDNPVIGTRSFGEEAKQDRVFEESLFWVVTRSLACFY